MGRKSVLEFYVEFMEVVNDEHQDDMVMNVKESLNSLAPLRPANDREKIKLLRYILPVSCNQ